MEGRPTLARSLRRLVPMRRLLPLLMAVVAAALCAGPGMARPPVEALSATAAMPPERRMAQLRQGHARVNEALAMRKARHAAWQKAVRDRDAAAALVERMKRSGDRGADLEASLREALALDEAATVARSRLMAAEAEVARRGAELLAVYDAVLADERRDIEALPAGDARRAHQVRIYQALADQRDHVRRALSPVLSADVDAGLGVGAEVRAAPDDDIETLLEKADLARDLEERFLRRAALVRRRIAELEEEQALARDVAALVRSQSLFDEEHRRLVVVSPQARRSPDPKSPVGSAGEASTGGPLAPPVPADDTTNLGGGGVGVIDPGDPPEEPSAGAGDPNPGLVAPGQDGDFGTETIDDGAGSGRGVGPDVGGTVVPQVTEQAFLGTASEVDLGALLASGRLSLPELRALEKKLREEAERMRTEGRTIRSQVKARAQER